MRSRMYSNSIRRCGTETPTVWRPFSNLSGWRPGAVLLLLLIATATACAHRIETIQDSRKPVANPDGTWTVTNGWLQEQGELIRGWRARAQACEADRDADERRDGAQ